MNASSSHQIFTPRYRNGNPIWKFFHIDDPQCSYAMCYECGKDFCRGFVSKNTTNLRTHLKQKHPQLHLQLLELCEEQRNLPPPPPSVVDFDDHPDVADTVSEYDDVEDNNGDDFFDASEDYIDEPADGRIVEQVENISCALVLYKPPIALFDAESFISNNFSTSDEHFTSSPSNSNSNDHHQHSQQQQQEDASNSPKPDVTMSEEELRKRLLIAQIEREKAQAKREISASGYFQACTAAIHSRFSDE
uniref:BED-type domain-containing protein n=1 Tax=Panagrolaimus sp. ES5 TaxID=591445 RepID=A0AC34GRB2_9BILA